ncbi:MAG: hypothetical protein JXA46_17325 [Dehalococcoidales bacterium]|nr:hypothetical protein [Dehalococcoidales bacterium]
MSLSKKNIRSVYGCRSIRKTIGLLAGESGLALPIVLGVLALGALVTAPFLAHASSNSIGSAVFSRTSQETYAAEAGVEHAIWSLAEEDLDSDLVNVGDSTGYILSDRINGISPDITVTRTSGNSSRDESGGTITHSVISSLKFDADGYSPVIVRVSSGIYAVVYRDSANRVVMKTLEISNDGAISGNIISSLVVAGSGFEPDVAEVSEGILAVVYRTSKEKGMLATVRIDSRGIINQVLVDQKVIVTSHCNEPRVIHASGNYYFTVYRGPSNKGYAATHEISSGGTITATSVSDISFSQTCHEPDSLWISDDYFAVVYRGMSGEGNLITLTVDSKGQISHGIISSLVFDNTACYTPRISKTSGSIFGIVYRGSGNDGYITTLDISTGGIISRHVVDTFEFDNSAGYEPYIIAVSDNVYAVVYRGKSSDGFLKTILIDSNGTINQTAIDTFEFDTSSGYEPCIIRISDTVFAIAYRGGAGEAGYIKTVEIATGDSADAYRILSMAGNTSITADITIKNGIPALVSWNVERLTQN